MRFSLIFALICCGVVIVLCVANVEALVKIFLTDPGALEYGIHFSRIMMTTGWLFGVYYVLMNAMQALGRAVPALIVSVCRQGVVYIPAVFILGAAMGMDGLVWAQPCADVISLALAIVLFLWSMKHSDWTAPAPEPQA